MSFPLQLVVAFGAFVAGSAIAGVAGADSLGIALSFGQIAFVLAVGYLILRGSPSRAVAPAASEAAAERGGRAPRSGASGRKRKRS